jgi:hypothetical protein
MKNFTLLLTILLHSLFSGTGKAQDVQLNFTLYVTSGLAN